MEASQANVATGIQFNGNTRIGTFVFGSPSKIVETLGNVVTFQCSQSTPPATYREDKTLYIVDFQGVPIKKLEHRGQVAGPMWFPRSSEPFRSKPKGDWCRCDITNYGNKPLRNVRARFPVQFLEVIKTDEGFRSGVVLAEGNALTPPFDLGAGFGNIDYFYFSNSSPQFIFVSYPLTAQAQTFESDQIHEMRLVPPTRDGGGFFMLPDIKHPLTEPGS